MTDEDKKDFNAMFCTIIKIFQNYKPLLIRTALKNTVESNCILHRRLTMTRL